MKILNKKSEIGIKLLKLADFFKDPRNPIRIPYRLLKGERKVPEIEIKPGEKINFSITVDTEHDFGISSTLGQLSTVKSGVKNLLEFFDKKSIAGTFFVSNPIVENFPELVGRISKNHEVGVHGYDHECWSGPRWWLNEDRILDRGSKEEFLSKMIDLIKDVTGNRPESFRAPYMTVDGESLKILDKLGFGVDSSVPSQYGIFPRPYKPDGLSLLEIPVSANPAPEFRMTPYPHSYFKFLIVKYLSSKGVSWYIKLIEDILKFQLSKKVPLHLVMVLHQWEFADVAQTPTDNSQYATEENLRILDQFLKKLEGKFEIQYLPMIKLGKKLKPRVR